MSPSNLPDIASGLMARGRAGAGVGAAAAPGGEGPPAGEERLAHTSHGA